jgi:hypothetical protein
MNNIMQDVYAADHVGSEVLLESIQCDHAQCTVAKVGQDGVTKIVLYNENGQMCYVPWAAIYKGDFLWQRVDLAGMRIIYSEAPHD